MSQISDFWRQAVAPELDRLVEIRHHLHMHPELAFEERQTSALVQRELEGLGLQVRAGWAKGTGVVAVLRGTAPGAEAHSAPAVALRADMDALPIREETGLPYASRVPEKMHACGHDGHTSCLLGVARVLARHRDRLKGSVVFCFQPAEETGGGGRYMVEEGVLDDPRCSAVFALHGFPNLPVGQIGVRSGTAWAATDSLSIVVQGKGGHGAAPHLTIDPIVLGARIVEALQSIVSREVDPLESAVVTIGSIHGGQARNVIPQSVELLGTIRSLQEQVRNQVHAAVRRTAEGVAAAGGGRAVVVIDDGYPVVVNDPAAANLVERVAREMVGAEQVVRIPQPSMGGEDFGYFLQKVPGMMFRLGTATRQNYPGLHHPAYDFSDGALPVGVAMFCAIAERFLAQGLA